jgi:hypothetical protein
MESQVGFIILGYNRGSRIKSFLAFVDAWIVHHRSERYS